MSETAPSPTTPPAPAPAPVVLDPAGERLKAPLGELLVREGLVAKEEVDKAIALQASEARRGVFLRLGELLAARGLVDEQVVARVLALQGRTILVCTSCLAQFNVVDFDPARTYLCNRCNVTLRVPSSLARLAVEDTVGPDEGRATGAAAGEMVDRRLGPFRILGEISRGGMGVVYKARQQGLDRIVAMKILGPSTTPADVELFTREARAVARLRHPYIVAIHEIGRHDGVDYFTMDYIEGQPFQRAVIAEGLSPTEVVEAFLKVCDAVEYAHGQGLLHRDIKPGNVLLDRKRDPVLIDFGIARATDDAHDDEDEIVGSPAYLPPEYITGAASYGIQGEVYALGATLYTVLAGRPPHTGIDTVQVLRRAQVEDVVSIRRVSRAVDRDLATVVMTALARDPASRYASVRELGNDLRRWLEGEEVAGRRSFVLRIWHRVRAKVAASLGLFVSLLFLTVTLGYNARLADLRREDGERLERLDAEHRALHQALAEARLETARMLVTAGRPLDAEGVLSDLLRHPWAAQVAPDAYTLRAEARGMKGDVEGAEHDRRAAAEAAAAAATPR